MTLLSSPTPAAFIATHLERRQVKDDVAEDGEGRWVSVVELLADDARALRDVHAGLIRSGTAPKAAANYVAGWFGGLLAGAVGYAHATSDAGLLVDESVRWRLHPGGWPDRVDVSQARVVVPPGHAWTGLPGVAVTDLGDVRRRTVHALVETLDPTIEVVRSLATVGRGSLWAEVADGLGTATAGCPELAAGARTIAPLEALLEVPGAPWRAKPSLWCASSDCGDLVVGQKGGCCLAYLNSRVAQDGVDLDGDYGRFMSRFPRVADEPAYCSTCRFRTPEDVEARLVFWTVLTTARRPRSPSDADRPPDRQATVATGSATGAAATQRSGCAVPLST